MEFSNIVQQYDLVDYIPSGSPWTGVMVQLFGRKEVYVCGGDDESNRNSLFRLPKNKLTEF